MILKVSGLEIMEIDMKVSGKMSTRMANVRKKSLTL